VVAKIAIFFSYAKK